MEFTEKELVLQLEVSQPALHKALKDIDFELKNIKASAKPVKHYKYEDLPDRYKEKLKTKGIEPKENESIEENKSTNISQAKFTDKYILATPDKKRVAVQRCKLIEFYLKRDKSKNRMEWLKELLSTSLDFEDLGSVSQRQLDTWLKKYNEAKDKGLNVVEIFIDARGASKGVKALSEEQKKVAKRYFLKTTRPVMTEVYRNMCHNFGDTMPSYDVLNNYYKECKRAEPLLFAFSASPDSAKNNYLAAFGDMSERAKYRNLYWELDSTPADVICDDGKRYTILAAIDIFSRRVVFHVAETSSSYSISQLLRKAILKLGIPENVVIDNGKDYTSIHFESICLNLGINMELVPPFSGECKPHVERVFGTLSRELFEQVPGYIGHNVAQRTELQARKSFADKIRAQEKWREEQRLRTKEEKDAWRDAWKIKKENIGLDLTVLLSPDELQTWCDKWVDNMYEQRVHKKLKTKPINMWNKNSAPVQSIPDERMLDLLLGESVTRKVGKKGIAFDGCNYIHLELVEYIGHHVYVMAPDDMGYILVYDENMKFICMAEDIEHMGESRQLARKAKKKSMALMNQLDKIVKEAEQMKDVTIMDRIDAVSNKVEASTYAVTKHTQAVDSLYEAAKQIEANDKQELEKSKRYDFKKKDEEGKPQKVLPSGRPAFESFFERFVWDLKNNMVDKTTEKLSEKYPDIWEMAKKEAKVG